MDGTTQKTAGELLAEIQRIAVNLSSTLPDGSLREVTPRNPGDSNWTLHWNALSEEDREFSQELAKLKDRYPTVDWSGVSSN